MSLAKRGIAPDLQRSVLMIIYFEGLPGSGKTTLIRHLVQEHPGLFQFVPEYLDPAAAEQASSAKDQAYFLHNDEAKYAAARTCDHIALVDRGHLSTILYNEAHELLKGQPLVDTTAWYQQTVLAKHLLPDLYVYLDTCPQTTFSRRPKTKNWDNIWDYEAALELARQRFHAHIKAHESHIPVLTLAADTLSITHMEQTVMHYLTEQKHI